MTDREELRDRLIRDVFLAYDADSEITARAGALADRVLSVVQEAERRVMVAEGNSTMDQEIRNDVELELEATKRELNHYFWQASDQRKRADRYRLAWLSARRRAKMLQAGQEFDRTERAVLNLTANADKAIAGLAAAASAVGGLALKRAAELEQEEVRKRNA